MASLRRISDGAGDSGPVSIALGFNDDETEVVIKGKTYYVMNETDSVIYDVDENGDISVEAGVYKNGKPSFNKK